ncbi:MAG: alpha/beta fold hydrolase [Myxococcota bacterium]|nr:alpha/beta fold hydrolase [Myxococcota bacterium]
MSAVRRHWPLWTVVALLAATNAHAGDPTRIQLVADIPALALSIVDASGAISGEVDGIATDALAGPNPGEVIGAAQLGLSIPTTSGVVTWGHRDGTETFVAGLPAMDVDGSYADPFPGAILEKLYNPPIEFDATGSNNAAQRSVSLAVRIEQPSGGTIVVWKDIVLVKPPVVLVHGISQNPSAWAGFENEFRNNRGFKTFAVDHSGGSYTSGAPTWGGNGDIHDSYQFVRGNMPGSVGVAEALARFRTGDATAHAGLKIVVQKADVVGSSYGGLLSRWYVEQAVDYGDDVRKLITMGTPHRGVPATNMNAQAANDDVIANASSQLFSPFDTMAGTLQLIDDLGFLRWKQDPMDPMNDDVVPSLQVMTFGSEVLAQLNDSAPFRDDVAYGSIVGIEDQLDFVVFVINIHYDLDPVVSLLSEQKSYFPMMPILDAGPNDSDAVVPIWSAKLPARSTEVLFDHLSFHDSATVQNTVSIWLQDSTLPLGAAHRTAFQAEVIDQYTSRENAYVGSTLVGTESVGGGLVEDAIVQVKFSGPALTEVGGLSALGSGGGIVTATMTGMVRVDVAGVPQPETVTLVNDGTFVDTPLHAVTQILDPGTTPAGEFFTFSIDASFSRGQASIVGPDGSVAGTGIWSVGYEISAAPDYTQAPWTDIDFLSFVLPTIFVPGESPPFSVGLAPGSAFTLEGTVNATAAGAATQSVTSEIWEANFFFDTLMESRSFNVSMPAETISGALMPYSEPGFFLFKNGSGQIEGSAGSSGETTGDFYQFLIQPGASNPSSDSVTVTVAP